MLIPVSYTHLDVYKRQVCIETVRNLIRPGSLAVRLIANIIAGHLLITLLGKRSINSEIYMNIIILIQILLILFESAVCVIQSLSLIHILCFSNWWVILVSIFFNYNRAEDNSHYSIKLFKYKIDFIYCFIMFLGLIRRIMLFINSKNFSIFVNLQFKLNF